MIDAVLGAFEFRSCSLGLKHRKEMQRVRWADQPLGFCCSAEAGEACCGDFGTCHAMHCEVLFEHDLLNCPYCHSQNHTVEESKNYCQICNQKHYADPRRRAGRLQKHESSVALPDLSCLDIRTIWFKQCFCERHDLVRPARKEAAQLIIVSHTGVFTEKRARLHYQKTGYGAHFVITKTGQIKHYLGLEKAPWLAGPSRHSDFGEGLNRCCIGVMLEGNGCRKEFTNEQYELLKILMKAIEAWAGRRLVRCGLGEVAGDNVRGAGKGHVAPGPYFQQEMYERDV